ncbi:MAG TPA: V-type ATP synthase subunit A, partial [Synergistaceae bacterium]|nr:V-type ATP synthase subunit A [Synergistaceae bacterium]
FKMLRIILDFHHKGLEALQKGASLKDVFGLPIREEITRMRYTSEDKLEAIDAISQTIATQMASLTLAGGESDVA